MTGKTSWDRMLWALGMDRHEEAVPCSASPGPAGGPASLGPPAAGVQQCQDSAMCPMTVATFNAWEIAVQSVSTPETSAAGAPCEVPHTSCSCPA